MRTILTTVKNFLGLNPPDPATNWTPREARERLKGNGSLQLVDVRTEGENGEGRIKGSVNIPLHQLLRRLGELDKTKPILLYCQAGSRSKTALRLLKAHGFNEVSHLTGGILAWGGEGLPIEN